MTRAGFKAFITSRRFVASVLVVALVGLGVGLGLYFALRDPGKKIVVGGDVEKRDVNDFKDSRLYLNNNNTFTVQIIYKDKVEFVGVGTYKKEKDNYTFYYYDLFYMATDYTHLVQCPDLFPEDPSKVWEETYPVKKGVIDLKDRNNKHYHFK